MKAARGFTLVEILVALSLMGLVLLGLSGALRAAAGTEQRVEARLARLDAWRSQAQFLRKLLERVVFEGQPQAAPGALPARFTGLELRPDALVWLGILPARPGAGGRQVFRLAVENPGPETPGPTLVLRHAPWTPGLDPARIDWAAAAAHGLVPGVQGFSIQAQGRLPPSSGVAPDAARAWQRGWPSLEVLPERLRLDWADAQGPWPTLILPLRPSVPSDRALEGFVIGGGGS